MRRTAAEKYAFIRLVEGSELPMRQTLRELRLNRSTFYLWYHRYLQRGRAGLEPNPSAARRYWNRIPPRVRQRVVEAALADPGRSPRELAWQLTDREGHFLSESSVYRILKGIVRLRVQVAKWAMPSHAPSYHGDRFPSEIISHAVWLYYRAPQQAVGKMTEGPSKSAVRSRLQTTPSGCH